MANIPILNLSQNASAVTFQAANGGGDSFLNTGNEHLRIRNGGGSPVTVTLVAVGTCSHGFLHDQEIVVAAGAEAEIKNIDLKRFGSPCSITYSGVTSVTVAAVR